MLSAFSELIEPMENTGAYNLLAFGMSLTASTLTLTAVVSLGCKLLDYICYYSWMYFHSQLIYSSIYFLWIARIVINQLMSWLMINPVYSSSLSESDTVQSHHAEHQIMAVSDMWILFFSKCLVLVYRIQWDCVLCSFIQWTKCIKSTCNFIHFLCVILWWSIGKCYVRNFGFVFWDPNLLYIPRCCRW